MAKKQPVKKAAKKVAKKQPVKKAAKKVAKKAAKKAAAPNVTAVVIRVLNEITDVPFGMGTSLSGELGINTNGRWQNLARAISNELPSFDKTGRDVKEALGDDDSVGALITYVENNI